MEGFIIRVTAYHHDPVVVNGIPTRASYSRETPVPGEDIINHPSGDALKDLAYLGTDGSTQTLLELIENFEFVNKCKVNFNDDLHESGFHIVLFDVFEPSWRFRTTAQNIIDDLTKLIIDWITKA